ncbi:MAG: selenocysteine-specific translation elongation factor, partial [Pseudomonadota bacterium]|nr:selenocysteine-specific translation elongation factor [Pseudomonadota bacterium]
MIVGTAGHIDHGKTTLVKALTGIDTDRLPEEKRRGISIELGYAYLDLPASDAGAALERIGFVDVPGHERLVATMLAGASGVDHALVVVAADDGVMPQTREHVAALALLGVAEATLVVTKVDRADDERIAAVALEASALLHGTSLAGAPVFAVATLQGSGIAELRAHLLTLAAAGTQRSPSRGAGEASSGFRLAVDRVFSLAGVGTVATGSAYAGRVAVGDVLLPLPGSGAALRARSLHAQGVAVAEATSTQRVAVNVAGAD